MRLLVIEDDPDLNRQLATALTDAGYVVDRAFDGEEGHYLGESEPYDAVILDLAMPGMDGIETLKRLLELDPTLQVILLTGHATVTKGVEAVKLGAVDFLEKPADIATLIGKITDAQQKKMQLFEKNLQDKMSDILKKKGW